MEKGYGIEIPEEGRLERRKFWEGSCRLSSLFCCYDSFVLRWISPK